MKYDHVKLDDSYYRDNLYSLLITLKALKMPVDTGDWFNEFIFRLEALDAKEKNANVSVKDLTSDIKRWMQM